MKRTSIFEEDSLMIGSIAIMIMVIISMVGIFFLAIREMQREEVECQDDCKELGWKLWRYKDSACYCLKDGEPRHIWGDDADFVPVFIPMSVD